MLLELPGLLVKSGLVEVKQTLNRIRPQESIRGLVEEGLLPAQDVQRQACGPPVWFGWSQTGVEPACEVEISAPCWSVHGQVQSWRAYDIKVG